MKERSDEIERGGRMNGTGKEREERRGTRENILDRKEII